MVEFQAAGGPLRQSLLKTFDACPLSAKFTAERPDFQTEDAALGSAMHLIAEELLRTLHRIGERQLPTQEVMEIAYECLARPECPHLTTGQMDSAKIMTLQLAHYEWTASKIIAIEKRLFADVPCQDGVTRVLTGSPDLFVTDPPDGVVIVDLKFGRTKPPKPRDGNWQREGGRPYLSERGTFQLDAYSLLVMRNYPAIERCTLREVHIRIDELREAVIEREELEHVERRLGLHMLRLEKVLTGELEPEARAGHHCHYCPRPEACPIPQEDRGEGAITTAEEALARAERWAATDATRDRDGKALKGWLKNDAAGDGVRLDQGFVGWKSYESGHRSFGLWSGDPTNGEVE